MAPYRPDQQVEEDDDFMDENQGKGIRVLGIAFSSARYLLTLHHHLSFTVSSSHLWFILLTIAFFFLCLAGRDHPVFCALVNGEGEVTDFLRLPHFTKRRTAWREEEREKKVGL